MAKLTLTDLTQLTSNEAGAIAAINANNAAIEAIIELLLSRDGTSPNTMTAELDMNSNKITNLAAPENASDAARLADVSSVAELGDVDNVTISSIAANEILMWNGSAWINRTLAEAGIAASPDLSGYITDITGEDLETLADVTVTSISSGELLKWNGSAWINNTIAEAGLAAASHNHATSDITSGTFADARVAESNVTQHEAALAITESQISDLGSYIEASGVTFENLDANGDVGTGSDQVAVGNHTHATSGITSGTFADARIAESNVTQHEAALSITESQISDLGSYLTESSTSTLTNKTIDADNNTISNIGAAEIKADIITGQTTAGGFASGDKFLIVSGGVLEEADYDDLPGATGGLNNIVEDTSPQLGGNLDLNGNEIGGVDATELGYVAGVTSAIQTQLDGKAASSHNHAASDVNSGTFADARIAESNVTQHEAALSITESQISDLGTYETADADILKADVADVLTVGFGITPSNEGTKSSGTFTPDEADGNIQYIVNGGAFTLGVPTNNCTIILHITNNGSAGAITTSGYTLVDGDSFDTTDTNEFLAYIVKANDVSHLTVKALQ